MVWTLAVLHDVLKYSSVAFFTEILWDPLGVTSSAWSTITWHGGLGHTLSLIFWLPIANWEQLWEHFLFSKLVSEWGSPTSPANYSWQCIQFLYMRVSVSRGAGACQTHGAWGSQMIYTQAVIQLYRAEPCPSDSLRCEYIQCACLQVSHSLLTWPADFSFFISEFSEIKRERGSVQGKNQNKQYA